MQFVLAPLAEYTDVPFRLACRACGAYYAYTPLIDAGALAHNNPDNGVILARDSSEPWLGVQLLGSLLKDLEISAHLLAGMQYEAYDFNMGCPMQKVVKRPAGAALMWPENQEHALQCVRLLRRIWAGKIFTVKMRILDPQDPAPTVEFARRLEDCGIDGLTIHGRIQKVIYSGDVAFSVIAAVREALRIPVTANGGIFGIDSARELFEKTGCERLMVARGAIGNPWIFRELTEETPYPLTHAELCSVLEKHVEGMCRLYKRPFPIARKIILSYLKGRGYRKQFREQAGLISSQEDFQEYMKALRDTSPELLR